MKKGSCLEYLVPLLVMMMVGSVAGLEGRFVIDSIERESESEVRVRYPASEAYYYLLERSEGLEGFDDKVGMVLGVDGQGVLVDGEVSSGESTFYRVRRFIRGAPRDQDGDGIDDVYELERAGELNPLDASDAGLDPDLDGLSYLEEYLRATGGVIYPEMSTSPIDGEDGVALTRETVLRFERPLAAGVSVLASDFFAEFAGVPLPGRIDVSMDRREVSLFYAEPLPAAARVRVRVRGAALLDETGVAFDVDGDGLPGGDATIDFDTLSLATLEGTSVCGRVFASNPETGADGTSFVNEPLAGVRVTVDGMEDELFAVTDALGNFRLEPAPVGRFFVHIDGRQSTNDIPEGAYYPFVGKSWTSRPGEEVTVGNIFLPLIVDGTLKNTSAVSDTEVRFPNEVLEDFPEFSGVKVVVPADALFADDGTRGGMVGIAPVPPDRLPGTLPQGLDLPLVITVQTDGATNFDRPVPVSFPNLPDPKTGRALPPGAKTAIWSFNHDSGRWEVAGPATISEDGLFAVSDPGTGIRAPGWHGTNPLCRVRGGGLTEDRDSCATERALLQSGYVQGVLGGLLTPLEAIPVIGDFVGTGFNFLGAGVDCWINGGDRMACATGFAQAGEMSLIAAVAGPAGDLYTNSLLFLDVTARSFAYEDCMAHAEALKQLRTRAPVLQKEVIDKARALQDLVTGDPVWSSAGPGGLRARRIVWDEVMEAAADGDLTEEEEEEIVEDETRVLPPDLTEEDIEQLIERVRSVIENGITVAEGEVIRRAARDLQDVLIEVRDSGWRTPLFVRYELLPELQREQEMALRNPQPIRTRVRYRLINRSTGFVQRGSTSSQGTFDLLVQPNTSFTIEYLHPDTGETGSASFVTGRAGGSIQIPPSPTLAGSVFPDSDGDDLNNLAELVLGTDVNDGDSDDDGILDGAEIFQGGDPLGGLQVRTGIIATAKTPGTALDVDARNDVVAVANGNGGVSLFNVFSGMDPTVVAQVGTPGSAGAVALTKDYLLVADGGEGAAIFDITEVPEVTLIHQIALGESISVAATAGTGYVGLASGFLVKVDLRTGAVLDELFLGAPVHDLAMEGDFLYAATPGTVYSVPLDSSFLNSVGSVAVTSGFNTWNGRMRLAVGGGVGYAVHRRGYDTVNLLDPAAPVGITTTATAQFGWKDVALNGSGLMIAARSVNQSFDGAHSVWLYDASNPALTDVPITELATPGVARAVSLFNGIAYVADHTEGMQVINYLAFDSLGLDPAITLTSNASGGVTEERKALRITADVSDDVQVRNVEFYLNDERLVTDGNFPFEHRFIVPSLADAGTLTLKARVSDTGGNATWSGDLVLNVTPDSTPPELGEISPADGAYVGGLAALNLALSEAVDPSTVTTGSVLVTRAGVDGMLGTGDDVVVTEYSVGLSEDGNVIIVQPTVEFEDDLYRVELLDTIADLRGNRLATGFTTTFRKGPLLAEALVGTPRDRFSSSANVGQTIFVTGANFDGASRVTFPTMSSGGSLGSVEVGLTEIAGDGRSGNVLVPDSAVTGEITLPDGTTKLSLQIVPVVTEISGGGPKRSVTISGSGFVEGRSSVRFGTVAVVDRGPFTNDGIDVYAGNIANGRLGTTVPENGSLPYVVVTDGGSSGVTGDVTAVIAVSETGTPLDAGEASANVSQEVRIEGEGFGVETMVVAEFVSTGGTPSIQTIVPDEVGPLGDFVHFTLPYGSRTGVVSVVGAAGGDFLQVVPRVTAISGGRGRTTTISGSGFTEGLVTARFGSVEVVDGGPFTNDGVDVWSSVENSDRISVFVPLDGDLPYQIVTEGGASGRLSDLVVMSSVSETGTPAIAGEDSANVGQTVTLVGEGYQEGVTKISLEAMNSGGTPLITTIDPESVSGDGTTLIFIVPPEARTGQVAVIDGGRGELLQIVPRVTAINGGRGRSTTISGSGFIEGWVTTTFGGSSVVDGGPFTNDGIDVWASVTANDRISVFVPLEGDLPYQVITEGGSSGRVSDVTQVVATSETGTPTDGLESSANVGQTVTLQGGGFAAGLTKVTLESMSFSGTPSITTIDPATVAPDGSSLTFVVPFEARTGVATVMNGGGGELLQIVPRVTAINGGKGKTTTISGTGFIEGFVTARFGPASVVDGGPFTNDGIDVWSSSEFNDRLSVFVPANGELPYEVITEGGSSGRVTDVSDLTVVAASGTPALGGEASANVGQVATLTGVGFVDGMTKVTVEGMSSAGSPFIITVEPTSINGAGTSLTFQVPNAARTGKATVLSGGSSKLLQVVPTLTAVSSATPSTSSTLTGSGFIEGQVSVSFGGAVVTDGGPFTNDGVDVWSSVIDNDRIGVFVPAAGGAPVSVTTEGGTSVSVSP
ncbi:MAG: Ig-like domain-containing protein [Verrucomicrobiaceae bacterium]